MCAFRLILLLQLLSLTIAVKEKNNVKDRQRRKKPRENLRLISISSNDKNINVQHEFMNFSNLTCHTLLQPMNHFSGKQTTTEMSKIKQRYCLFDGYNNDNNDNDPIFFYTGNESPIETYANHTGLMWTLGKKYNATIVFAEHRYEGKSLPVYDDHKNTSNITNCLTFCTSSQALADYASLILQLNPGNNRPVIAFGGSYGGMLSAWLRMKYPSTVAGAISASAPIWGTPLTSPKMDSAYIAITRGVILSDIQDDIEEKEEKESQQQINNSDTGDSSSTPKTGFCHDNLKGVWPLIVAYGKTHYGRSILNKSFHLCQNSELKNEYDTMEFLNWVQSMFFYLSEGNYPFETNYITYALLTAAGKSGTEVKLPAWPISAACRKGGLNKYHNIDVEDISSTTVNFDVTVRRESSKNNEESADIFKIHVLWDEFEVVDGNNERVIFESFNDVLKEGIENGNVIDIFEGLNEAIGVWYNVTGNLMCYDALSNDFESSESSNKQDVNIVEKRFLRNELTIQTSQTGVEMPSCLDRVQKEGIWNSLCCNENLELPIYFGMGMGNDFFWPPSYPEGTKLDDVLNNLGFPEQCKDPQKFFGYPDETQHDPFSTFIDTYYGGLRIGMHSNIVFSQGLLDPWSGGGVFPGEIPRINLNKDAFVELKKEEMIHNITDDGSIISLWIERGAHHLDLFYENEGDPECVKKARLIEEEHIQRWIDGWKKQMCPGNVCNVR